MKEIKLLFLGEYKPWTVVFRFVRRGSWTRSKTKACTRQRVKGADGISRKPFHPMQIYCMQLQDIQLPRKNCFHFKPRQMGFKWWWGIKCGNAMDIKSGPPSRFCPLNVFSLGSSGGFVQKVDGLILIRTANHLLFSSAGRPMILKSAEGKLQQDGHLASHYPTQGRTR